ncbi:uncharacterized protein SCHCODRAFT_01163940 [Schizophyllum commune H4-8]|uniref:DUF6534 domain-containing protein n=1 Tax=Schizophyllum commune (strain H4-8 / FGSC 9210) TaxID=578458 RepID=D8QKB1_SCHCM|nr:uncharacterized protein SCHCODRAFT_01163940 [Schizophyllum commune H4-8]KAI5885040.1 hypothetical protein SCHCODRAFT_01163940 [Schizophyllum commune H4-8]
MATPASPIPDVTAILGPILIGSAISWVFWGLLTMQVIQYYVSYKRDRTPLKTLVGVVWVLDGVHAIVSFYAVYRCLVNDLESFRHEPSSPFWCKDSAFGVYGSVARLPAGSYGIPTVYRNPIPVALFLSWSCQHLSSDELTGAVQGTSYGYLADVLIADTTMATMLSLLLYFQRRKTPYKRTSQMLTRLLFYSVNTGTWTAVFVIATIVLCKHPKETDWWAAILDQSICGVYSNTLLANLNARDFAAGERDVTLSARRTSALGAEWMSRGAEWASRGDSSATEDVLAFAHTKRSQVS